MAAVLSSDLNSAGFVQCALESGVESDLYNVLSRLEQRVELLVESWRLSVRVVFSSSPPSARAVFANVATLTIALLHSRSYRLNLRQASHGIDVNKLHETAL